MPTSLNLEHFDLELPVWVRLRVNKNWGREPAPGEEKDPYAHELFTSIAISALARPKILFDIALAGSKITAIPALRDGLYAVISQALDKALVSPNKINIQKAPDNHVINFPHAVGIVHVNVLQAMDLPAADWSTGQCDPYVKLLLSSKGKIRKQEAHTKMIEANRFPVYAEHFEFRTFNEASDTLELSVWDYDTLTAHDFLGKAKLKLSKMISSVEGNSGKHVTEWLKIGGEAKLEVEYWYERIVEEEPNMANVEIEDYEYRLGTDVGEDAKTVAPKKLTAEEVKQLELVGAAGLTKVEGAAFGLKENPGGKKK